jgi:hypothetical protein
MPVSERKGQGMGANANAGKAKRPLATVLCKLCQPTTCCCLRLMSEPAFAAGLEEHLPGSLEDDKVAARLTSDIEKHIQLVRSSRIRAFGNEELDRLGTCIWNLAIRLRREAEAEAEAATRWKSLQTNSRVFAFLILDLALWSEAEATAEAIIHLTRIALKAGRSCIGEFQSSVALLMKSDSSE